MAHTNPFAALTLLLLLAVPVQSQTHCEPWFKHHQIGAFYLSGFAMVDLDPNGWRDLVGYAGGDGLEIWRFGPEGSVTLIDTISTSLSYTLLAADFDNDGDTDLISGDAARIVYIFKNTSGTLVKLPGTYIPDLVAIHAATDLDQDSLPDLVIRTSTDIVLYRNDDDGTFTEWTSVPFEDNPASILPASLNHDGLVDLIAIDWNKLTPLRQNADGTFEVLQPITIYNPNDRTLAGDINGDGLTDILYDLNKVLLCQGQGEFAQGADLDPRISGLSKLTDLDHDGDLDLLVNASEPNGTYGTAYTMFNDGSGTFTILEHNTIVSYHSRPKYTLVEDVNRDGHLDLVVQRGRLIDLRFGSGDGFFDDVPFQPFFTNILRRATLGDIDADGDLDVVATGDDSGPVIKVLTNDGSGVFTLVAAMAAPSTVYERVSLADFDSDGDLDILTWTAFHGLWIYENTPDGFFSQVHTIPHRDGGPTAVPFVLDINNSGRPDIVAGDTEDDIRGYTVYRNRGGWDFARKFTPAPMADHILAVADFDNDGKVDLLSADSDLQEDELHISYMKIWQFTDPAPIRVFGDTQPFAMPGDFNGDGWMDFVSYGWLTREVKVMINQRDGTFLHTATLERLFYSRDPGVLDLDGDGFDELVCASQSSSYLKAAVYTFNAAGEVIKETRFGNAIGPMLGSSVGDLNGDGATDILLVSHFGYGRSGGFSVFLNQCPGAPCLADFNNDGILDTRDFTDYLSAWADQINDDCSGYDCSADLDKNGTVDTRDFVTFLSAWAAGC